MGRGKFTDLTGQHFGRWTVVSRATNDKHRKANWNCVCDCGNKSVIPSGKLSNGSSASCGCLQREIVSKVRLKHGMSRLPIYETWIWIKSRGCVCERWVNSFENFHADMGERPKGMTIKKNSVDGEYSPQNCIWAPNRFIRHGKRKTSIHNIWVGMRSRCFNKNHTAYRLYGGRGIGVCRRWLKFKNFYEDMGEKPEGMSLDRIDNNGNYCPRNCRWATPKEQTRNARSNINIKYQGRTQCLMAWAEGIGVNYNTLYYRIKHYPPQIAFNM